jgi:4-amino-4-deoxy-L-arabinose transferase-like glycosyltransferase
MSDSALLEGAPRISIRPRARIEAAAPFAIFAGVFLLLWLLFGNRLILGTNDEGIYLDAAERILHGQKPYVDFFGYMSPGSFWMQALAFRLFGVTLAAGRVLVLFYVAIECALIYWLVERYASRLSAILTTLFFLAFQTADATMLTAQHRWDSGALALASIAICVSAQSESRRRWLAASGVLIAAAALATPSIAIVGLVTLAWLAWPAGQRVRAAWYLLGLAAAGAALGAVLWSSRMLAPLVQQIFWLSRNYAANNAMPYGAIIGGYGALFEGAGALELLVRAWVVFCLALPAILPVAALVGGGIFWARRKSDGRPLRSEIAYLLICIVALVASTYPRSDIAHLAWVSALPYAVAGILAYHLLPARPRAWLTISMAVWAIVFALQGELPGRLAPLRTPVGEVRASAAEAPVVTELLSRVQPGQSLFVYPYKPLFYFLTQTSNPTRYSYLEAGMMTSEDARLALSELEARPPKWVLYMDLDRSEFARVFPAGKRLNPHYPQLESWIQANYRSVGVPSLGGYVLLRRAIRTTAQ